MHISRRRLLLSAGGITAVGAVATLVLGTTFGFFSSTPGAQSSTFNAAKITLTNGTYTDCSFGGASSPGTMVPGDTLSNCVLPVTYSASSSVSAWVSLDVRIQYPTAGIAAYGGDNIHGLTFTIKDNETAPVTFTTPTTASYTGGDCPALDTCWQSIDQLAAVGGGAHNGNTAFAPGDTVTWTAAPSFPTTVGNTFQSGQATIVLSAHAVQDTNNGSISAPACTVGTTCDQAANAAWPVWS